MNKALLLSLILLYIPLAPVAATENVEATVNYGPPRLQGFLENKKIDESSGMAASNRHRGTFWTHNDSGDKPRIFAFDEAGKHRGTCHIKGAEHVDWEDMGAFLWNGQPFVFVADTGDNGRRRKRYIIYTALEPDAPQNDTRVFHRLEFQYEDGASRDCEAVAYDARENQFVLVEKRKSRDAWRNSPVWILKWDPEKAKQECVAQRVGAIAFPIVTGLDLTPSGDQAVIITYFGSGAIITREARESWQEAVRKPLHTFAMPPRKQGEAVCFGNDAKTLFLTSEKEPSPLYRLPIKDTETNP